jgi:hypothetical protein
VKQGALLLTNENQTADELFMCPNDSCKKAFSRPLKALDFQTSSGEVYEACPHCLTRISSATKKPTAPKSGALKAPETMSLCPHHLGYLCERVEKEQIPDECIVCKDIVACLLKSLKT